MERSLFQKPSVFSSFALYFRSSRWFLSYICPAMPPFRLSSLYLLLSSPLRLWPPAQFRFRPLRFQLPGIRHCLPGHRELRLRRRHHLFPRPALSIVFVYQRFIWSCRISCASFRDTTSTSLPNMFGHTFQIRSRFSSKRPFRPVCF